MTVHRLSGPIDVATAVFSHTNFHFHRDAILNPQLVVGCCGVLIETAIQINE